MNLGIAIRTWRKHRGMRQRHLSEATGISINAISLMEKDLTWPHKASLEAICSVLNIPMSYLLFFSVTDEDIPENVRSQVIPIYNTAKFLLLQ